MTHLKNVCAINVTKYWSHPQLLFHNA